jgi:NADPH:quinone reductase-like Zn-dependent oxidoreductase
VIVAPNGAQLEQIAELVAAGRVKPIIHSVFPLEKAA